jgi:hypothetical protein
VSAGAIGVRFGTAPKAFGSPLRPVGLLILHLYCHISKLGVELLTGKSGRFARLNDKQFIIDEIEEVVDEVRAFWMGVKFFDELLLERDVSIAFLRDCDFHLLVLHW